MAEKLHSNIEPQQAIEAITSWMQLDLKKMSDADSLQLFYFSTDVLIEDMEKLGYDVKEIKNAIKHQMELFQELIDIKYPDIPCDTNKTKSLLPPLERISLKSDPLFMELRINKIMLELKELAEELLNTFNHENEEFQDMSVGSAAAPVIEGFRKTLQGALAKIPRSKDRSPNN